MPTKRGQYPAPTEGESADVLVSETLIAERWSCSRSTVRRILEAAGIPAFYLSGRRRGIKRFRLSDVKRVEESARTESP